MPHKRKIYTSTVRVLLSSFDATITVRRDGVVLLSDAPEKVLECIRLSANDNHEHIILKDSDGTWCTNLPDVPGTYDVMAALVGIDVVCEDDYKIRLVIQKVDKMRKFKREKAHLEVDDEHHLSDIPFCWNDKGARRMRKAAFNKLLKGSVDIEFY